MLPSAFVESANFPVRWQEKDLQEYIANRLKKRGFQVECEVQANGGRADIVSNWQGGTIIEVKKYLDRNTIYQAFGQANLYGLKNKHKLVIMGFMAPDTQEQKSALNTASMIQQDPRVSVIFVNLDKDWLPGASYSQKSFALWRPSLPTLSFMSDKAWWAKVIRANPLIVVLAVALFAQKISVFTTRYMASPSATSHITDSHTHPLGWEKALVCNYLRHCSKSK